MSKIPRSTRLESPHMEVARRAVEEQLRTDTVLNAISLLRDSTLPDTTHALVILSLTKEHKDVVDAVLCLMPTWSHLVFSLALNLMKSFDLSPINVLQLLRHDSLNLNRVPEIFELIKSTPEWMPVYNFLLFHELQTAKIIQMLILTQNKAQLIHWSLCFCPMPWDIKHQSDWIFLIDYDDFLVEHLFLLMTNILQKKMLNQGHVLEIQFLIQKLKLVMEKIADSRVYNLDHLNLFLFIFKGLSVLLHNSTLPQVLIQMLLRIVGGLMMFLAAMKKKVDNSIFYLCSLQLMTRMDISPLSLNQECNLHDVLDYVFKFSKDLKRQKQDLELIQQSTISIMVPLNQEIMQEQSELELGMVHRIVFFAKKFPKTMHQSLNLLESKPETIQQHAHDLFVLFVDQMQKMDPKYVPTLIIRGLVLIVSYADDYMKTRVLLLLNSWAKTIVSHPSLALAATRALLESTKKYSRCFPRVLDALRHQVESTLVLRKTKRKKHQNWIEHSLALFLNFCSQKSDLSEIYALIQVFLKMPDLQPTSWSLIVDCFLFLSLDFESTWLFLKPIMESSLKKPEYSQVVWKILEFLQQDPTLIKEFITLNLNESIPLKSLAIGACSLLDEQVIQLGAKETFDLVISMQNEYTMRYLRDQVRKEVENLSRDLFESKNSDVQQKLSLICEKQNVDAAKICLLNLDILDLLESNFNAHIMTRLLGIPCFCIYWKNKMSSSFDPMMEFKLLISKLSLAVTPNQKCNFLSCLTAFAITMRTFKINRAQEYEGFVYSLLVYRFLGINQASQTILDKKEATLLFLRDESELESEEIQCTVCLCLCNFSCFEIIDVWKNASNWVGFASNYLLSNLLLERDVNDLILQKFNSDLHFREAIGLALGLAKVMIHKPTAINEKLMQRLRQEIQNYNQIRSIVAAWVLVFSKCIDDVMLVAAMEKYHQENEIQKNLRSQALLCFANLSFDINSILSEFNQKDMDSKVTCLLMVFSYFGFNYADPMNIKMTNDVNLFFNQIIQICQKNIKLSKTGLLVFSLLCSSNIKIEDINYNRFDQSYYLRVCFDYLKLQSSDFVMESLILPKNAPPLPNVDWLPHLLKTKKKLALKFAGRYVQSNQSCLDFFINFTMEEIMMDGVENILLMGCPSKGRKGQILFLSLEKLLGFLQKCIKTNRFWDLMELYLPQHIFQNELRQMLVDYLTLNPFIPEALRVVELIYDVIPETTIVLRSLKCLKNQQNLILLIQEAVNQETQVHQILQKCFEIQKNQITKEPLDRRGPISMQERILKKQQELKTEWIIQMLDLLICLNRDLKKSKNIVLEYYFPAIFGLPKKQNFEYSFCLFMESVPEQTITLVLKRLLHLMEFNVLSSLTKHLLSRYRTLKISQESFY